MTASEAGQVTLLCRRAEGGPERRRREPVTCGIPWPQGALGASSALRLIDENDREQLLQRKVLDRWPDGTARWVLLDWLAEVDGEATYRAVVGGQVGAFETPLKVESLEGGKGYKVETGTAVLEARVGGTFPFDELSLNRHATGAGGPRLGLAAKDDRGVVYGVAVDKVTVEEQGAVRICLRFEGRLVASGKEPLTEVTARAHCFAGSSTVRIDLTLTNPRPAGHPGGKWSLGSKGAIHLADLFFEVTLPRAEPARARISPEIGGPFVETTDPIELHQESSGGESWNSSNHVNRHGAVPMSYRGYRLKVGDDRRDGRRATPVVALRAGDSNIALASQYFWQDFPKAIEASNGAIRFGVFPRQFSDVHELQGGEQKTHTFFAALDSDSVTDEPLDWVRSPLIARAEPEWYAGTGAVPRLVPEAEDSNVDYRVRVRAAVEGDDTFFNKREVIDEYGWRHFGDVYGDHEAVYHEAEEPLVSHYNNQFDAIRGFALQFLRSGDPRWFRLMDELTRHVIDIDTYHTDEDKSAYNGGQFWHTAHYVDAGTSTHRTYPPVDAVSGGGPSPGQLYSTGLMLHHFLTGSAASREIAIQYGTYVIDADDGRKTVFRFLDRGPTGHVSESGFDRYHGPGRTPANAINALVDSHRLTGERKFLDKAEELVRRCIHPNDDVGARNLLDAENRWYYTMFLQSLGKYLEYKAELSDLDETYAYTHAALLSYARWAAEHEYPYLEKPEILEYPTETWAAQDMRKSEVFNWAAMLVSGEEQARFLERARFFFDYSVKTLNAMFTGTLCRPVVLLLSNGSTQAWFDQEDIKTLPSPLAGTERIGQPEVFEPQKVRAIRRFKRSIMIALIAMIAAVIVVVGVLL